MQKETIAAGKAELLEKANKIIQKHDDFIEGMIADDVEQKRILNVFNPIRTAHRTFSVFLGI